MALTAKRPSDRSAKHSKLLQEVKGNTEKKRRLNAEIEDSLYREIKRKAVAEDRSISEITRRLWIEYLSN